MNDSANLTGRFALVSGSTRGIGRAIADSLAGAGCHVVVSSRSAEDASAAAEQLQENHGVRALGLPCDVSSLDSVRRLFSELRAWSGGRLDVLVCNAGYPFDRTIWDTPLDATPADKLEDWYQRVYRTDTLGSVFCTYDALPMMMRQRSGSIVYISSTPALRGFKGIPYTIAKAGVLGLMKDVAAEYGKYNIRANALALGNIETPATFDSLDPATQESFSRDAPLGRWGKPGEVARAALFLAGGLSSFVTGQTLVVDGGIVRW